MTAKRIRSGGAVGMLILFGVLWAGLFGVTTRAAPPVGVSAGDGLNYQPPAGSPSRAPAAALDCEVQWASVRHDTFDVDYRDPRGAVAAGAGGSIRLRLRTAQDDLTSARVRVWDDRLNQLAFYVMTWDAVFDTDPTTYDYWTAFIPLPAAPTILYYYFELNDDGTGGTCIGNGGSPDQDWYMDDDPQFLGGGVGQMHETEVQDKDYQITVYDPAFTVPEWMQRGVVYQVFPDRFRDGQPDNNPINPRFFYEGTSIYRSNTLDWNTAVCDPRTDNQADSCAGHWGDNFYGGDLAGITQQINNGYFASIGVTVLYLTPIFQSPSNHKYDTTNYLIIDPDFGTLDEFRELLAAADAQGIRVILDGVFHHTGADSKYFDLYSRYDLVGNLTSPFGPGLDDDSGACESSAALSYSWYVWNPAANIAPDICSNGPSDTAQTYEGWNGAGSLPVLRSGEQGVRDLVYDQGLNAAAVFWTYQGAAGWRLDAGEAVDPGLTQENPLSPNDFWESFRSAVRDGGVTGNDQTLLLGEAWGDATSLLLGGEWDSVMNYRFRSAVLGWLFTGCTGNGCTQGKVFEDNDSSASSPNGPIFYHSPAVFNARLLSIWEDYPPTAWKAMLNLAGSHDTNRIMFLLEKINQDDPAAARQRLKELWIFAFTYPGSPGIYYGDEVGLSQPGVWAASQWEDDPYNRAPFPWEDTPGDFLADTADLLPHFRKMASIRHSYRAFQDGDVVHGIVLDDARQLYGYARISGDQVGLVVLNRSGFTHEVVLDLTGYPVQDGETLYDALNEKNYLVSGGTVAVTVPAESGVVLLQPSKADIPAAVGEIQTHRLEINEVLLRWQPALGDILGGQEVVTHYTIHGWPTANYVPGPENQVGVASVPPFGGLITFLHTDVPGDAVIYTVCAVNAAGRNGCSQKVEEPTIYTPSPTPTPTETPIPTVTGTVPAPTETFTPAPPTDTPTPTSSPPGGILLPDLSVLSMQIALETGGSCSFASTELGVRVWFKNQGQVDVGLFVVSLNGVRRNVRSLAAGETGSLWFAGYQMGENTALLDPDNDIQESDETNNMLVQLLPIPTLPPTCTPTGTLATATPSLTPSPTATLHPTITGTVPPDALTPTPTFIEIPPGQPFRFVYTDADGDRTIIEGPAGAVTGTIALAFQPMLPDSTPPGFRFAGTGFNLNVVREGKPLPGFSFLEPVAVTLEYSDKDVRGLAEDTLMLDFWDPQDNAWRDATTTCTPVYPYERDLDANWIRLKICHLTQFSLFAEGYVAYLPLVAHDAAVGNGGVLHRLARSEWMMRLRPNP